MVQVDQSCGPDLGLSWVHMDYSWMCNRVVEIRCLKASQVMKQQVLSVVVVVVVVSDNIREVNDKTIPDDRSSESLFPR
jgi:hypothetical protein